MCVCVCVRESHSLTINLLPSCLITKADFARCRGSNSVLSIANISDTLILAPKLYVKFRKTALFVTNPTFNLLWKTFEVSDLVTFWPEYRLQALKCLSKPPPSSCFFPKLWSVKNLSNGSAGKDLFSPNGKTSFVNQKSVCFSAVRM